jgi:uncharacterized protein (TIGR03083 family)
MHSTDVRVNKDFVFAAVADERRRIAALIERLDGAQLTTESLCAGWDVKTVAAHLVSVFADGFWGFQAAALRHGGIHRGIDALARRRAQSSAPDIAAALRRGADHRLSPPVTGPVSGLADVLVHGGDIRIPLGIPFDPNPRLVTLALDFLTGGRALAFVPFGRLRGIGLRSSDVDRSWGRGAEVRGPAPALMMAVCGRDALFDQLDGPGLELLRNRLTVFRDRS